MFPSGLLMETLLIRKSNVGYWVLGPKSLLKIMPFVVWAKERVSVGFWDPGPKPLLKTLPTLAVWAKERVSVGCWALGPKILLKALPKPVGLLLSPLDWRKAKPFWWRTRGPSPNLS
jgi:hypothetical protein